MAMAVRWRRHLLWLLIGAVAAVLIGIVLLNLWPQERQLQQRLGHVSAVESPQFLLVGALLTWGLSELSYRFVEQPIRSASWFAPKARGRRAYFIGAFALLALTSVTLVWLRKSAHQGPAFTTTTRTDPCFGAGASLGAGRGCASTRPSPSSTPSRACCRGCGRFTTWASAT